MHSIGYTNLSNVLHFHENSLYVQYSFLIFSFDFGVKYEIHPILWLIILLKSTVGIIHHQLQAGIKTTDLLMLLQTFFETTDSYIHRQRPVDCFLIDWGISLAFQDP